MTEEDIANGVPESMNKVRAAIHEALNNSGLVFAHAMTAVMNAVADQAVQILIEAEKDGVDDLGIKDVQGMLMQTLGAVLFARLECDENDFSPAH